MRGHEAGNMVHDLLAYSLIYVNIDMYIKR